MNSVEINGMTFHAIPLTHPGGGDRVEHTVRHFLEEQEEWRSQPPFPSPRPAECRAAATALRAPLPGPKQPEWWSAPLRAVIDRAHDSGFMPRYFDLARRAGRIGIAGSRWTAQREQASQRAEVLGYVVAGRLVPAGFQVLTAFKRDRPAFPRRNGPNRR